MANNQTVSTPVDDFVKSEELKSALDRLDKNFIELFKKLKFIQDSVDLVYKDRDLLKDIYAQGEANKALILALDKHNETLSMDLKADVADTKDKVSETSEAVKDTVEHHVGDLADKVDAKKTIMLKGRSWLGKLRK